MDLIGVDMVDPAFQKSPAADSLARITPVPSSDAPEPPSSACAAIPAGKNKENGSISPIFQSGLSAEADGGAEDLEDDEASSPIRKV